MVKRRTWLRVGDGILCGLGSNDQEAGPLVTPTILIEGLSTGHREKVSNDPNGPGLGVQARAEDFRHCRASTGEALKLRVVKAPQM